jgi:hypothetical protein
MQIVKSANFGSMTTKFHLQAFAVAMHRVPKALIQSTDRILWMLYGQELKIWTCAENGKQK